MQLFILLVLLSHVAMVTAVASCHGDRDKDHRPRANCTAAGFSDVPAGFEPTTKVLLFPNNLFSSLSWSSFQIFIEIYEIDLTGNKVPEVTSSAAPVLPSLSVLRLGSNRLTSLSDGSFSACPALTELYLDHNALGSLSDHTFSGLSKLEILDLSYNHIKVLPELMLHPLPAIETLFLENNKIKVMPDDWFSQKEEVPYLYLSANLWACYCSLGYLHRYLDEYELNIYVRDGLLIKSDGESVVCDSPQRLKGKPVISLEESDLCPPSNELGPTGDFYQPIVTDPPYKTTTAATTVPAPSELVNFPTVGRIKAHPTTAVSSPPPPTSTTATTTATAPAPTSTATLPHVEAFPTEYHRVVTWYFSEVKSERAFDQSLTTDQTPTPNRPSTESPANTMTAVPTTPVETTKYVPSAVTSSTPKLQFGTTSTSVPSWMRVDPGGQQPGRRTAVAGAGLFCASLFAGCLLLCVASAVCTLVTLARLVIWYRRVYKPLSVTLARRGGGSEGVRLLTYSTSEEKEVARGGATVLYRSVLFINREGGEAMEGEDRGKECKRGGEGEKELLVTETGGGATRREEAERGGGEERGMYRKTLYRLYCRESEIEGWRDVMEECRLSAEGGGKDEGMDRERSGGGVSRKRYSVILREERGEAGGGREDLDWVVGGWEVKGGGGGGGGEEPRSSWGEWLANYLPSIPWEVTTPPEGEAVQ